METDFRKTWNIVISAVALIEAPLRLTLRWPIKNVHSMQNVQARTFDIFTLTGTPFPGGLRTVTGTLFSGSDPPLPTRRLASAQHSF